MTPDSGSEPPWPPLPPSPTAPPWPPLRASPPAPPGPPPLPLLLLVALELVLVELGCPPPLPEVLPLSSSLQAASKRTARSGSMSKRFIFLDDLLNKASHVRNITNS